MQNQLVRIDPSATRQLWRAVKKKEAVQVAALLKGGADPNARTACIARTPLMLAASLGALDVIKELLVHGALLHHEDKGGRTALHHCAQLGPADVATMMLDWGAEVPGDLLARGQRPDLVAARAFLIGLQGRDPKALAEWLGLRQQIPSEYRSDLAWALERAVMYGSAKVLAALLQEGAVLSESVARKAWATFNDKIGGLNVRTDAEEADIAAKLPALSKLVDLEAPGLLGKTMLASAASEGKRVICQTLLDLGANVDARDKDGYTPLMLAAGSDGTPALLRLLASRGANVNAQGKLGSTALAWARPRLEMVQVLLDLGADPSIQDTKGYCEFARAREMGMRALEALLNKTGKTPSPAYQELLRKEEQSGQEKVTLRSKIRVGMSLTEVLALLGPPSSKMGGGELLGMFGSVGGSAGALSALSQCEYYVWNRPEGEWKLVVSNNTIVDVYAAA